MTSLTTTPEYLLPEQVTDILTGGLLQREHISEEDHRYPLATDMVSRIIRTRLYEKAGVFDLPTPPLELEEEYVQIIQDTGLDPVYFAEVAYALKGYPWGSPEFNELLERQYNDGKISSINFMLLKLNGKIKHDEAVKMFLNLGKAAVAEVDALMETTPPSFYIDGGPHKVFPKIVRVIELRDKE